MNSTGTNAKDYAQLHLEFQDLEWKIHWLTSSPFQQATRSDCQCHQCLSLQICYYELPLTVTDNFNHNYLFMLLYFYVTYYVLYSNIMRYESSGVQV